MHDILDGVYKQANAFTSVLNLAAKAGKATAAGAAKAGKATAAGAARARTAAGNFAGKARTPPVVAPRGPVTGSSASWGGVGSGPSSRAAAANAAGNAAGNVARPNAWTEAGDFFTRGKWPRMTGRRLGKLNLLATGAVAAQNAMGQNQNNAALDRLGEGLSQVGQQAYEGNEAATNNFAQVSDLRDQLQNQLEYIQAMQQAQYQQSLKPRGFEAVGQKSMDAIRQLLAKIQGRKTEQAQVRPLDYYTASASPTAVFKQSSWSASVSRLGYASLAVPKTKTPPQAQWRHTKQAYFTSPVHKVPAASNRRAPSSPRVATSKLAATNADDEGWGGYIGTGDGDIFTSVLDPFDFGRNAVRGVRDSGAGLLHAAGLRDAGTAVANAKPYVPRVLRTPTFEQKMERVLGSRDTAANQVSTDLSHGYYALPRRAGELAGWIPGIGTLVSAATGPAIQSVRSVTDRLGGVADYAAKGLGYKDGITGDLSKKMIARQRKWEDANRAARSHGNSPRAFLHWADAQLSSGMWPAAEQAVAEQRLAERELLQQQQQWKNDGFSWQQRLMAARQGAKNPMMGAFAERPEPVVNPPVAAATSKPPVAAAMPKPPVAAATPKPPATLTPPAPLDGAANVVSQKFNLPKQAAAPTNTPSTWLDVAAKPFKQPQVFGRPPVPVTPVRLAKPLPPVAPPKPSAVSKAVNPQLSPSIARLRAKHRAR